MTVGAYEVNAAGQLTVRVTGAEPSTNYEIYFRPLNNSGDIDTGIALPTDSKGNDVAGPKGYFAADTVAAGTFVVKESGADQPDQFVAGFQVH